MPAKKKLVLKKKSPKKSKNIMKKMEDLTPSQIDKISQNRINTLYYSLFMFLIFIIFFIGIIKYLKELEKCDCFLEKNVVNNANLKYLIYFEYVLLAIYVINFLYIIYLLAISNQKGGANNIEKQLLYLTIYVIFFISVFVYFVYSVYKMQKNIDPSCECSISSFRYLLYIQAFFIFISIINLIRFLLIIGLFASSGKIDI
jgi:hypothetical protein